VAIGTEEEIIQKVRELDLEDFHDAYFYRRGHFEELGLGESVYDYYGIREEMEVIENRPVSRTVKKFTFDGDQMSIYNLIAELNDALPQGISLKVDEEVHDGYDTATLTINDEIQLTAYTPENLRGDIAIFTQDIVNTIIKYVEHLEENGNPDIRVTPLATAIMTKGIEFAKKYPKAESDIPSDKQEMLDAIHNLVGVFGTAVVRLKYHNSFTEGAIESGKKILEENGITILGT
jgi:hypothetical protein